MAQLLGQVHLLKGSYIFKAEYGEESGVMSLGMDHYYLGGKKDGLPEGLQNLDYWNNHDHPDTINFHWLNLNLGHLLEGETTFRPAYTFGTGNQAGYTNSKLVRVAPAPVILIEGLFALHDPVLQEMADLKLYVHTDDNKILPRRIDRDSRSVEEGGRGKLPKEIILKYFGAGRVEEMCRKFVLPTRDFADAVIVNNNYVPKNPTREELIDLMQGAVVRMNRDLASVGGRQVELPRNPNQSQLEGILRNARANF